MVCIQIYHQRLKGSVFFVACTLADLTLFFSQQDINNESDYKEMVKKVYNSNSTTTKILVVMKSVKILSKSNVKNNESGSNKSDSSEICEGLFYNVRVSFMSSQSPMLRASNLDSSLAYWHIKLQNLYKNEFDEGFTYANALFETSMPLTPAMILDWCHALVGLLFFIIRIF